jgi:uncharacterized membrane protein
MPELIAIAYTEETVAAQAAAELDRCAAEIPLDPDAVGVIVAERNGTHQLLTSRHPGATAAWSKFWGVVFGVVMNEAEPSELDLSFRQQVKGLLRPGSSVLMVAVDRVSPATILAAVSQYGGTHISCRLGSGPLARMTTAPRRTVEFRKEH